MGGQLTVESEPGRGATFRVRLPMRSVVRRESVHAAPRSGRSRRARLLVIDDEAMIGNMLKRILAPAHDVEAVTSPDAALARLAAGERFDLILCDLMMPERSGMDVHAALSRSAPEQARRMLFLTAGAFSAAAATFIAEHTHLIVNKPFQLRDLSRRIDAALDEADAKDEAEPPT